MKKILLTICFLLTASPAFAAYNAVTLIRSWLNPDNGSLVLEQRITGNAGEVPVLFNVTVTDPGSTATLNSVAGAANQVKIAALNAAVAVGAGLIPNQAMPVTYTPTPPAVVGAPIYRASTTVFTPGATPQDVCTLRGSATKTLLVSRVILSTQQTTAGRNVWHIVKRSTANTGGTSAAMTMVPLDSAAVAATATALTYTANPTAGTLVGRIEVRHVASPAPATATLGNVASVVDFAAPVMLRGASQVLGWNFNGVVLPAGLSITCTFEWSEL